MDLQKGDLVIYDGDEYVVHELPELRTKIRITNGKFGKWVNTSEVERIYKFREGERAYYKQPNGDIKDCIVEKVLKKKKNIPKNEYLIWVENENAYFIRYETDLLKRKNFDDLEEGDSFFLPSGEKIRMLKIEFDDYEGIYKCLIGRQHGEIQLVNKDKLKGWV
jgi:hypothetical protein